MITLTGLSELERELADRIWNCDGMQEVDAFIDGLPKSLRPRALGVLMLITAAVLDEIVDQQEEFPEVQALVDRIKDL